MDIPRYLQAMDKKLDWIIRKLQQIAPQGERMSAQLDALAAQVAQATTVEESAITLINNLAAQIQANAGDPVKMTALAASLQAESAKLAAAITANTALETSSSSSSSSSPAQT